MKFMPLEEILRFGISKRFIKSTIGDLGGNQRVKKQIIQYMQHLPEMKNKGVGLYIHSAGNGRAGKSLISNIIALSALAHDYSVRIISLTELTDLFFDNSRFKDAEYEENFVTVVSSDFLILDSLDSAGPVNQGSLKALFECIKLRERKTLPIILVSDLDFTEESLGEAFGENVFRQ
jgi:hypothetical protein